MLKLLQNTISLTIDLTELLTLVLNRVMGQSPFGRAAVEQKSPQSQDTNAGANWEKADDLMKDGNDGEEEGRMTCQHGRTKGKQRVIFKKEAR